jgi:hypothetical protein
MPFFRPHRPVRMRPADPADADFHLLEELAKPRACLTAGRITVWVYHAGPRIQEIVLSGHAESRTCASVTSILIEGAKQLRDDVHWMLTCGAAYFRAPALPASGPAASAGGPDGQVPLREMVEALKELERENGLVEVLDVDWHRLEAFREGFRQRVGAAPAQVVLPNPSDATSLADYLPIVPGTDPRGRPLVFHLEGWDFDCPEFQAVADVHLHKMQRELLRDALRRRRTYRTWLKEWMEQWVPQLHWLPEAEVRQIYLEVPAPLTEAETQARPVPVSAFLNEYAASFLDRGQDWHRDLGRFHEAASFGRRSAAELDREYRTERITVVDIERCVKTERATTPDDPAFTLRQYLSRNQPSLISHCLLYIRRMDAIIKPYEELRVRRRDVKDRSRDAQVLAEISRRIIVETMIRGWPSFYLDDKEDRVSFDAWAREYRPRVWSLLARQARQAGVALEQLLEDNVVYDVRFDDDLGCTVQPLLLIDNCAHAQVHGKRLGASAVVPVWSRGRSRALPADVLALGRTNRDRAARLVERAAGLATGPAGDAGQAAGCLRLALACHPAEAGRRILQEWSRRLGRDTRPEFERARLLVCAKELWSRGRFAEVKTYLTEYLAKEPEPLKDAYVMVALAELAGNSDAETKLRDTVFRLQPLRREFEQLLPRVQPWLDTLKQFPQLAMADSLGLGLPGFAHVARHDLERLEWLGKEIQQLNRQAEEQSDLLKKSEHRRCSLIEQALRKPCPARVVKDHPALAQAARLVPKELRATLETKGNYSPGESEALFRRYGDVSKIIEVRGLFDIVHVLGSISYRIGRDHNKTRLEALGEMRQLCQALWLPDVVETDLKALTEEFAKGDWDHLQANQIRGVLREGMNTCLARMLDLLSDRLLSGMPLAEPLATRVQVLQTMEAKYRLALQMLLEAKVVLGRAVSGPWEVLDRELEQWPEGGRLDFDTAQGIVSVDSPGRRTPLLRAGNLSAGEKDYLAAVLSDEQLPYGISRFAACLAEGLLAVDVAPGPEWQLWCAALSGVRRELLYALSNFSYEVSLMPELAPPKSEAGEAMEQRLDQFEPRNSPTVDWTWADLGPWRGLLGRGFQRVPDRG